MTLYQILIVISSYLGLGIIVFAKISSNNKAVSDKLEKGRIKMTEISKDIEAMKTELAKKANKELVTEQLATINEKLADIKSLLEK